MYTDSFASWYLMLTEVVHRTSDSFCWRVRRVFPTTSVASHEGHHRHAWCINKALRHIQFSNNSHLDLCQPAQIQNLRREGIAISLNLLCSGFPFRVNTKHNSPSLTLELNGHPPSFISSIFSSVVFAVFDAFADGICFATSLVLVV